MHMVSLQLYCTTTHNDIIVTAYIIWIIVKSMCMPIYYIRPRSSEAYLAANFLWSQSRVVGYSYTASCCGLSRVHEVVIQLEAEAKEATNWIISSCIPDEPQQLAVQLICTAVASYCAHAWWPLSFDQFVATCS